MTRFSVLAWECRGDGEPHGLPSSKLRKSSATGRLRRQRQPARAYVLAERSHGFYLDGPFGNEIMSQLLNMFYIAPWELSNLSKCFRKYVSFLVARTDKASACQCRGLAVPVPQSENPKKEMWPTPMLCLEKFPWMKACKPQSNE